MKSFRALIQASVCILALIAACPALAQETQPGDACAVGELNHVRLTGGPETTGTADILRCNGFNWQSQIRFTSAGPVGIGTLAPTAAFDVTKGFGAGSTNWGENAKFVTYSIGNSASPLGVAAVSAAASAAATGAAHDAVSVFSLATTGDDATSQNAFGFMSSLRLHANDTGYGIMLDDADASTGGKVYGVYINLDNDNVERFGLYQTTANPNYLAGSLGIGRIVPAAMLDVNGGVRIGYNGAACAPTNEGEIRYSSGGAMEYCDGSDWTSWGSDGDIEQVSGMSAPSWGLSCTQRTTVLNNATVTRSCNAGEIMTGGGCSATANNLRSSNPSAAATWQCVWTGANANNTAHAVCCTF